jgi:hypothetical protein
VTTIVLERESDNVRESIEENVQKHLRLEFGNIRRRGGNWWEVIFV